jgi:hypothetical protein
MSEADFIIVPMNVLRDSIIGPAAKLLYGRLRLYAGKDGRAYPKHETLASEVCLAERQVRYLLMELKAAGWIDWTRTRTSCVYTIYPDRQKSADQARQDVADLSAEKCRSRLAEKCQSEGSKPNSCNVGEVRNGKPKRSIENHHQNRKSQKKESPCAKSSATPEDENQKPFSKKVDDDEKPKPRAPFENPEMEFSARIAERHGTTVDMERLLQIVRSELDCGPLSEFLEEDLKTTTAPDTIRNVGAYYRDLARKVMRQKQVAGLEWTTTPLQAPQPTFKPSCTCNDGRLLGGGYCTCKVGEARRDYDERFGVKSDAVQPAVVVTL